MQGRNAEDSVLVIKWSLIFQMMRPRRFLHRLDKVKRAFVAKQKRSVDNLELISSLLDLVEAEDDDTSSQSCSNEEVDRSAKPMLKQSGTICNS